MSNVAAQTPLRTAKRTPATAAQPSAQTILRLPTWAYILGLIGILIALVASGGLTVQHIANIPLPGCGGGMVTSANEGAILGKAHESACATLEAHPMGSLGGMWVGLKSLGSKEGFGKIEPLQAIWPVSFLGATYFAACLAAWLVIGFRRRQVPRSIVWLSRLGALASLVYIVIIVASNKLCPYCIASHTGNFILWLSLEIGMMKARALSIGGWKWDRALSPLVAGLAVFAIASGTLWAKETQRREGMIEADRREKRRMDDDLKEKMAQAKAAQDAAAAQPKVPWGPEGFRGRWLKGPKETPIRVVMLTDFQCPDCYTFDGKMRDAYKKYEGKISWSIVHYPMCKDCNPHVGGTLHANACRAAEAAEAACLLARNKASMEGKEEWPAANDMFWKMHEWLFSIRADFDTAKLKAKATELGLDPDQLVKMTDGPGTHKIVEDETIWGEVLGLFYTPMMFVNGVEVRGWRTNPNALNDAIEAVAAANPPAMDARNDKPDLIGDKKFKDWKAERRRGIEPALPGHTLTAAGVTPKIEVVVFGDLTEPNCKVVDKLLRKLLDDKKAFGYTYRHYPVNKVCNPGVDDRYPNGCLAARAVEAGFVVGGQPAYLQVKDLIFKKQDSLSPTVVAYMANVAGLDPTKFEEALNSAAVKKIVDDDVRLGQRLVDRFLPSVWVDGKYVERWQEGVLERCIDWAIDHPGEEK